MWVNGSCCDKAVCFCNHICLSEVIFIGIVSKVEDCGAGGVVAFQVGEQVHDIGNAFHVTRGGQKDQFVGAEFKLSGPLFS